MGQWEGGILAAPVPEFWSSLPAPESPYSSRLVWKQSHYTQGGTPSLQMKSEKKNITFMLRTPLPSTCPHSVPQSTGKPEAPSRWTHTCKRVSHLLAPGCHASLHLCEEGVKWGHLNRVTFTIMDSFVWVLKEGPQVHSGTLRTGEGSRG